MSIKSLKIKNKYYPEISEIHVRIIKLKFSLKNI